MKPASNVQVMTAGGQNVTVSWTASEDDDPQVAGDIEYHVYAAPNLSSPFMLRTVTAQGDPDPVDGTMKTVEGSTSEVYMVRAVKLETTPSGTYFNASQGAFWQSP